MGRFIAASVSVFFAPERRPRRQGPAGRGNGGTTKTSAVMNHALQIQNRKTKIKRGDKSPHSKTEKALPVEG
jgi:hypothetical protein